MTTRPHSLGTFSDKLILREMEHPLGLGLRSIHFVKADLRESLNGFLPGWHSIK